MAIEVTRFFGAEEKEITLYNGAALINYSIEVVDLDGNDFPFDGYVSAFWRFKNERSGKTIKNLTTQISRNSKYLVVNSSIADMTFKTNGKYYYEVGYVMTGGYEVYLAYGKASVI